MHPQLKRIAPVIAVLILCSAHFAFVMRYFEPAISTPDANGYLGQATLIAQTGRSWFTLETPLQYVGMHWLKTPSAADESGFRYYSRYPPGLSLIEAAALKLHSPTAALIVDPLLSTLTLLALFLLCRLWVGAGWALLATAAMAVNPAANMQALSHFAHAGVAFFFLWGLYFLALWERTRAPGWALAAGLFLGIVPSVRYPEALLVAGCALFFLLNWRNDSQTRRSLIAGVIGLAIPMTALLIRNQQAFGAFWKTGYALTNEQAGFGWNYVREHFTSYLDGLQSAGAGPFFILGIAGLPSCAPARIGGGGASCWQP